MEGGGWGRARRVMGIKEGTCCHEPRVLYMSDESLNSTPETKTFIKIKNKINKIMT